MSEKPAPIKFVKLKMFVKGKWADSPRLRRGTIFVERPGFIIEASDKLAEAIIEAGRGTIYKGSAKPGEIEKLTKDEQAISDILTAEMKTHELQKNEIELLRLRNAELELEIEKLKGGKKSAA